MSLFHIHILVLAEFFGCQYQSLQCYHMHWLSRVGDRCETVLAEILLCCADTEKLEI